MKTRIAELLSTQLSINFHGWVRWQRGDEHGFAVTSQMPPGGKIRKLGSLLTEEEVWQEILHLGTARRHRDTTVTHTHTTIIYL